VRLDQSPDQSPTEHDRTADQSQPIEATYRVQPGELERAIERTGARYMADIATLFDRIEATYRDQLTAKDQAIEQQAERIREWQARAADLQARLEALEAQPEPRRPWWKWWG
jgi:histidinol dehydrogenase